MSKDLGLAGDKFLHEGKADAHGYAAAYLAFYAPRVYAFAHVVGRVDLLYPAYARRFLNLYLRHVRRKGVGRVRDALPRRLVQAGCGRVEITFEDKRRLAFPGAVYIDRLRPL